MKPTKVRFHLLSYWHAGTGHGRSAELDAQVARTRSGLPYLPGRTVKGLLRNAMRLAETAGVVESGRTVTYFGTGVPSPRAQGREAALEEARFSTRPGLLRFESARLRDESGGIESWERYAQAAHGKSRIRSLYRVLSWTAIDARGIARDQTLRTIEVTVPVDLVAEVTPLEPTDLPWRQDLGAACLFLHSLGSGRNRGLGRVEVGLEDE